MKQLPKKLDIMDLLDLKDEYLFEQLFYKVNELRDYLSDKEKCSCRCHSGSGAMYCVDCESKHDPVSLLEEASKGECNHHPNFIKDNGDCVMCVLDKPKNPPQQEESRGEKLETPEVVCKSCGAEMVETEHYIGSKKLRSDFNCSKCGLSDLDKTEPQLKEESPKEDETPQADWVKEFRELLHNPSVADSDLIDFVQDIESLAQQRTEKKWRERVAQAESFKVIKGTLGGRVEDKYVLESDLLK